MNCILCGVGGQGTVLASKLIARTALDGGLHVRTAETIGMAQRGGSVVSHVRVSRNEINSPLVPLGEADIIIGFEPAEAVRVLPYLRKGGTVVVGKKAIRPVTASLSGSSYTGNEMLDYLRSNSDNINVIEVDGEAVCEKLGSPKVLNITLLGAALKSGVLDITEEQVVAAIKASLKEKFHEINIAALKEGMKYAETEVRL